MYIISKIDYKIFKKFDKLAYGVSVVLLFAVLIPGVGMSSGGATRWIKLGTALNFQPSEVAKVALVIFFASYLTDNRDKLDRKWEGFFRPLLYLGFIVAILVGVQKHLSASLLIIAVTAIMMMMAGTRLRYFLGYGSIAAARWSRYFICFGQIF